MFPCEDSWCFIIDLLCCQGCCVWLPCYCQVLAWQSLLLVGLLVISCGLSRNVTGTYPRCNNFDILMFCFKYLQLNNSITVCFRSAKFSHPNDFLFHGSLPSQTPSLPINKYSKMALLEVATFWVFHPQASVVFYSSLAPLPLCLSWPQAIVPQNRRRYLNFVDSWF